MKILVVNADDLGYDPEIDRGILEAHARGLVSSATAMVETPHATAALRAAPATLGLGLHAVIDPASGRDAAEAALRRQLATFRALRGASPTHLDSHKHAHAAPAVLEAFVAVAAEEHLPVRALDATMRAAVRARGVRAADHFLGDAALRPAWTEARLLAALEGLDEGVTELMAHPGYTPRHARTSFGVEREVELAALCSPRARREISAAGVRVRCFADAWKLP
jgi:chitin disaccharide deacetylase